MKSITPIILLAFAAACSSSGSDSPDTEFTTQVSAVANWNSAIEESINNPRIPIPDTSAAVTAEIAEDLTMHYPADGPRRSGTYRLIQQLSDWSAFREIHGGPEHPDLLFTQYSIVVLRIPVDAEPEDFAPALYYLQNGIHVVFPVGAPNSVIVERGDKLAFYLIPREHNNNWPVVRTIRYADQP